MSEYALTPAEMHEYIDKAEKNGVKAFIISTAVDGEALSPSKKRPWYKIPLTVSGYIFKTDNLLNIFGFNEKATIPAAMIMVRDLSLLSQDTLKGMGLE